MDGMSASLSGGKPIEGEHPAVVMRDIAARPRPGGHVMTFANEKGGVGKSTLAFHCAIALAEAGQSVAVIDLDRRQQSLATALTNRQGTARNLKVDLPMPRFAVLDKPCGAQLSQEIARIGQRADFVIIDAPGQDSPVVRRAIGMADTLVTPVNCSYVDLDILGRLDPATLKMRAPGQFGGMVEQLRAEREACGMGSSNWAVVRNRSRPVERRHHSRVDRALESMAQRLEFQLCDGLQERVVYRELFLFGLTHMDIRHIPRLARKNYRTGNEIERLIEQIDLEFEPRPWCADPALRRGRISEKAVQAFDAIIGSYA
ncbi:MAG: AAA family ATPase [Sphingomonadales bacterium]|nr:AAA family ATPase [Sphingomonadales bacterium]MBD3772439.1 AAA family ATPase [Paracoccaceae bacterium]